MAALEFVKEHIDTRQRCWQNIWWTDESETEVSGRERRAASGEEGARKTSAQLQSAALETSRPSQNIPSNSSGSCEDPKHRSQGQVRARTSTQEGR